MIFSYWKNRNLNRTINTLKRHIKLHGHPDYEALLEHRYTDWLSQGDTVIDIGAHKGRHLNKFIEIVGSSGTVIAFEPLPFAYEEILGKYKNSNVSINNIALSDSCGVVEFVYNEGAPEESGLKERIYNTPETAKLCKIQCKVETLDSYTHSLSKIDFIKIDTEGGEIGCLRGALKTLEKFRPLVSVEYGFPAYSVYNYTKDTLFDFAQENDYILYDLYLNRLSDRAQWKFACDSVYWDYFLIPKEKEPSFLDRVKLK